MPKRGYKFFAGCRLSRLLPAALLACSLLLSGCGLLSRRPDPPPAGINCTGVIKTAYSQLGKKYRSGGASPQKGFDCSGLVWWSYKQHGVKLPRITTDQAKSGRAVSKKQLKPGDIVVFRTSASPRGLHTGLYAGGGSFIHSPGRGKAVRLDELSAPHWRDKLIAVRRIGK